MTFHTHSRNLLGNSPVLPKSIAITIIVFEAVKVVQHVAV
jgi:hypothetical protein